MKSYSVINNRPLMDMVDTYALRGVCMLMIMFHHLMKNAVDSLCSTHWGDIGTAVFFMLSGWGLCCSMQKQEQVGILYLTKNIMKLLIPFFIVWFVCLFVCLFVCADYFLSGWNIMRDFVTLTYPLAWPGVWFIKVIFTEYVITITSFMLFKNKILKLLLPTLATLIYIAIAWHVLQWPHYLYCTSLCFIIGLWWAMFHRQLNLKLIYRVICVILFFGLYLLTKRNPIPYFPPLLIYAVAFCFFMIFLVSVIDIDTPILHFIGKNSLLFYLIHIPIIDYTFTVIHRSVFNPWYVFILLVLITGVLCVPVTKLSDKLTSTWLNRKK